MKRDGPKILPIGKGKLESAMLKTIHKSGFRGPFGILGHVHEADVREILKENLSGLKSLNLN